MDEEKIRLVIVKETSSGICTGYFLNPMLKGHICQSDNIEDVAKDLAITFEVMLRHLIDEEEYVYKEYDEQEKL
jgi:hypothetical protein